MDHPIDQQPVSEATINTPTNNSDNDSEISTKLRSLDTVKALHDTVTTLRNALEDSRNEISKLKKQISVKAEIEQRQTTGKLAAPFKFSTRQRSRSTGRQFTQRYSTYSSREPERKLRKLGKTTTVQSTISKSSKITKKSKDAKTENDKTQLFSIIPNIKLKPTTSEAGMASKIDVKIKVSSNIQVDGSSSNSSSEDGEQAETPKPSTDENPDEQENKSEDNDEERDPLKIEDNFMQLKVSSKENLSITKSSERVNVTHLSTENLHLDVDNISQHSISEGDNSVFTDNPPQQQTALDQDDPIASTSAPDLAANASSSTNKISKDSMDQTEEVDDIDLIFSSDDNKEVINQEDLVSISEYEPWEHGGESGTPILVNFRRITSDTQTDSDDKENIGHGSRRSRQENRQRSDDQQHKSLESTDSLSFDNMKNSLDFNTKSSSLDKDSSGDQPEGSEGRVCRDESFDTFEQKGGSGTRKWTNFNVLIETDISKCGIHDENTIDMGRRNTCPNPTPYRPIIHTPTRPQGRNPLAVKFCKSPRSYVSPISSSPNRQSRSVLSDSCRMGPKMCSSAQTDITALPQYWRSETHLTQGQYAGLYTLPSKFTPPRFGYGKFPLRSTEKTQEARRVLLSDINFTSMVPELSRSADHLCHEKYPHLSEHLQNPTYYKGNQLKTPDYTSRGLTSNFSMSPNVSQWTVNETSFGTQTAFGTRGDSFDSIGSRSMGSRYSSTLSRHHRSRSVPSVRCVICRQNHGLSSLRTSESMHYGARVQFQEPMHKSNVRGSLPDLRHVCSCSKRYGGPSLYRIHADSAGSTDSLLEEAEEYLRHSMEGLSGDDLRTFGSTKLKSGNRRCSENDIIKDYTPSKQSLPFLPKSSNCLKPGHLAKVITKNGRVVVGRVRYVGPLAGGEDDFYIGLQLQNNFGDCDGSVDGRRFFDCQPLHGIFVPFKKIVMAWNS